MIRKKTVVFCAVLVFWVLFCGSTSGNPSVLLGGDDGFTRAVRQANPGLTCSSSSDLERQNLFSAVLRGNAAECLDIQALPAVENGIEAVFMPCARITVVFAVDVSRTDERPRSWKSLLEGESMVGIPNDVLRQRMILGAAAYGLEGTAYTKDSALGLFRQLEASGRLTVQDAPVTVCLDAEAVQQIRAGKPLELIVPEDGSLCFDLGILSARELQPVSEKLLLEAGLCLTDGRRLDPSYPDENNRTAAAACSMERFASVTKNTTRDFRRTVFHTRLFNTADGRETVLIMTAACMGVLLWMLTALNRSCSKQMQHWILLLSGQMLGWILVCLIKYLLDENSTAARIFWYGYYPFLMGLPLTMLYVGVTVDKMPGTEPLPGWYRLLAGLYPLLCLMVFTNDRHQRVFRFASEALLPGDYSAGMGYYVIFGYCVLCFVLSLIFLIQKSRRSPKVWGSAGPALMALLLILYNAAYALKIPAVQDSNLTLVFCLTSMLFLEAVLHAGLIPTNKHYQELFASSPLNMQMLSPEGETILRSAGAEALTEAQRERILNQPQTPFYQDENTLLHSQVIHGGIAVWQEDVTRLTELERRLRIANDQLKTANALLHRESQIRRQAVASEVKKDLSDQLEKEINTRSQELSRVIRELPEAKDRSRQIGYLPLLLCHLKRRCNLFFLTQEGNYMSSNELVVYLDELSEFAAYGEVRGLVRCGISGNIPLKRGILLYDFYFFLICWAIRISGAVLIGQIEQDGDVLSFGILCSCSTESLLFENAFLRSVTETGGRITYRTLEDSQGIYLTFRGEGA